MQSAIDLGRQSDLYRDFSSFCSANEIDFAKISSSLLEHVSETQARCVQLAASVKLTQEEISGEEGHHANLKNESAVQLATEEEGHLRARLEAESVLASFHARVLPHVPAYQDSSTPEEITQLIQKISLQTLERLVFSTEVSRLFSLLGDQLKDVIPFIASLSAKKDLESVKTQRSKQKALGAIISAEYENVIARLQKKIDGFFYTKLINSIYRKIDPHPDFKEVKFVCEFPDGERPHLLVLVSDGNSNTIAPNLYFSAAQTNILSLSIFLARALHVKVKGEDAGCIFIDDPIHSMDSINVLATIDLLRTISKKFDRQVILSTHDRNFFELLKKKIPEHEYGSKFIELETFGRVMRD